MNVRGATVLVTGANRGIGAAYARAFLDAGAAKVYGAARDPASVTDAGRRARPHGCHERHRSCRGCRDVS